MENVNKIIETQKTSTETGVASRNVIVFRLGEIK